MEMKIARNEKFNSFEIIFNGKPGEKIREILKANGYRWHKARGLWYGYKNLREILTTETGEQLNEQDKPEKTDEQPARVPTIKPIRIFYNGVKIDGGALIKIGIWTNGEKITLSAGSLPRGYGLAIENDSDPYRDYFADDYAEIYPDHPLYKFFKAAALKNDYIRKAKAFASDIKYFNRRPALFNERMEKALTEREKRVDEAREIAESNDCGQPTTADLLAVEDYIEKKKAEREAAEREQREQDERARRAYSNFCRDVVEKKTKAFPLTDKKNYVKIWWSECSAIDKISEEQTGDGRISLTAADEIFAAIDYYMHTNRENSPAIGWYDKTKFSIIRDGEIVETERIDLGDGDGGLHNYFMSLAKWSATHDENGREKPEEVDDETMDFIQWLGAAILAPKADADKQAEKQAATEEQAKAFCERENKTGNRYKKENRAAHYTPWTNGNKTENGFIAWYYNI